MGATEKACFGQCGNMGVRYRDLSKQHFLYLDAKKMRECDACLLFVKCMFLRYNEIIKDLLRLMDQRARDTRL